ncbi:MAG: hypothetical protein A3J62_03505 [Candidatus Buchananbacteria bacterium RIFCSPHIGHO2_02_FULL_38_8]|uniref:Type 4 fimbrial biogenesis protein PilX N-terminal domain-containing protein n=2 Tax=Candidatus Buchananiibacteriota TaxID=1817903 RepID=A0A1G1XST8_9BACT|nr:MAG: hypothetical protein A2731_03595 [Candidatus Buchananbacteria bacterium RIFCSPHIGHO2_01_FULL_39_8]OGY47230.1 MAG: hypothetical protein A3J62_03505 [Candidatus Buchananbacteria bacterium RIFCSPHIGHO2_02_FULL_38_8]
MTNKKSNGFVLIMSVLIMTALLMSGAYLITVSGSDTKITKAHSIATRTYYLAEAGINEMIWKIQNDQTTKNAFLAGTLNNSYDINRTSVFGDNKASYNVTALNTVSAEAQIIATSTYQIGDNFSQRVVKTYVSRATSDNEEWEFSTFAGGRGSQQNGNFTFTGSGIVLTANGGRLHANQVFKVQGAEVIVNDGAVTASNVIDIVAGGRLTLNNSYQDAPTTTIDMLQIDFDSSSPDSWKNRATVTYTETQFRNLPSNTTLNGIIYVTGNAKIIGKNFTINGVLVAEDNIEITNSGMTLIVNSDPVYGGGLLAKDEVEITTSGGNVSIAGLIYAANDLEITSSGTNFTVNGSLTGFDARITASGGSIILNYEPENFYPVINPAYNPSSPLIQIDHWEEQY